MGRSGRGKAGLQFQPDRRRPAAPALETGEAGPAPVLTQRELAVLRLLARGAKTAEIARELGISATTVRNHVQHILAKMGAHTRLQAVSLARGHQLV